MAERFEAKLGLDNKEFKSKLKDANDSMHSFSVGIASVGAAAAAAAMIMINWFRSTQEGANAMNTTLIFTRQIITDLMRRQNLHLKESIDIARRMNEARMGDRMDMIKEAILLNKVTDARYEAADANKTSFERMELLNTALKAYNELIDYKITDSKNDLKIVEDRLKLDKSNVKLLDEQAKLITEIIKLEGQRKGESRQIYAELTRLEKERAEWISTLSDNLVAAWEKDAKAAKAAIEREARHLQSLKDTNEAFRDRVNILNAIPSGKSFYEIAQTPKKDPFQGMFGGSLAGAPDVSRINESLQDQMWIVNDLHNAFANMFMNVDQGFKGMADSIIKSIKRMVVEMAAWYAVMAILNLIAPGSGTAVAAFTGFSKKFGFAPFANGGLAYGPTLGMVGEYAGARSNPEVIAPLDKLKGLMGAQEIRVIVDGKISGRDIRLANRRNGV